MAAQMPMVRSGSESHKKYVARIGIISVPRGMIVMMVLNASFIMNATRFTCFRYNLLFICIIPRWKEEVWRVKIFLKIRIP